MADKSIAFWGKIMKQIINNSKCPLDEMEKERLVILRPKVHEILKLSRRRFLEYASHVPEIMTYAIALAHNFNGCDASESINQLLEKKGDAECLTNIDDLMTALCHTGELYNEIEERLAEECKPNLTDIKKIKETFDLVAALPPPIELRRRRLPESMTNINTLHNECHQFGTLVEGLLDLGSLAIVYGAPGAGKSFLAFDLAARIAAGMPWRGRATTQGAALYVAAEGGAGLRRRALAWRRRHNENDVPLAIDGRSFDLMTDKGVVALLDACQRWSEHVLQPLRMLVIDTAARCMGGADENGGAAMAGFVANLARIQTATRTAVVVVHHSGKDAGKGPRGHNSFAAAVETILRVEPGLATVEKQRDGETGATFATRLVQVQIGNDFDGKPIMSATIEHLTADLAVVASPPDPLPSLVAAVRAASGAGAAFKLHKTGGLYQRRAELPAPVAAMGREALVALAKRAIDAGLIVNTGGTLTAPAAH